MTNWLCIALWRETILTSSFQIVEFLKKIVRWMLNVFGTGTNFLDNKSLRGQVPTRTLSFCIIGFYFFLFLKTKLFFYFQLFWLSSKILFLKINVASGNVHVSSDVVDVFWYWLNNTFFFCSTHKISYVIPRVLFFFIVCKYRKNIMPSDFFSLFPSSQNFS